LSAGLKEHWTTGKNVVLRLLKVSRPLGQAAVSHSPAITIQSRGLQENNMPRREGSGTSEEWRERHVFGPTKRVPRELL